MDKENIRGTTVNTKSQYCEELIDEYHSNCSNATLSAIKLANYLDVKYRNKELKVIHSKRNHASIDPSILDNKNEWVNALTSVIPKVKNDYKKLNKKDQNVLNKYCEESKNCTEKRKEYQNKCVNNKPTSNNEIESRRRHVSAIDNWENITNSCYKSLESYNDYKKKKAAINKKNKRKLYSKKSLQTDTNKIVQAGNGILEIYCQCGYCADK